MLLNLLPPMLLYTININNLLSNLIYFIYTKCNIFNLKISISYPMIIFVNHKKSYYLKKNNDKLNN